MSVLQDLLGLGLVDVGSDDSRFEKMELASVAFEKALREEPRFIIQATLIALDKEPRENAQLLDKVEELVVKEWKTMRNTHTERPCALLRSIIIDSLSKLVAGSPVAAGVIWQTAASLLRHGQSHLGKEVKMVGNLVQSARDRLEIAASTDLKLTSFVGPASNAPPLTSEQIASSLESEIESDDLLHEIASAAGPQYAGEANEDPNPHWPNTGQPWSDEFVPRMAEALVSAVNLGTERATAKLVEHLNTTQGKTVAESADSTLAANLENLRIRLEILWWSKALYSPSLRCGYREVASEWAAVAMAIDLCAIAPAVCSESVSCVLAEAALRVGDADARLPKQLRELVGGLVGGDNSKLSTLLPGLLDEVGPVPLVNLVRRAIEGATLTDEDFRVSGLDPDLELTIVDFSRWIFRDVQARRLADEFK